MKKEHQLLSLILGLIALAVGLNAAELRLNWQDNSDNESGFLIERSIDGGSEFLIIDQTLVNEETYLDTGLIGDTEYWYRVRAYNSFGNSGATNVASAITNPDGNPPTPPTALSLEMAGKLTNISSRGLVEVDQQIVIGGFVIEDGPVKILMRGVGPTLSQFGITNPLPNPRISLVLQDGTVVLENDNWSGTDVAQAAADVGAFPLPAGSLDAALLINLPPGTYTTHLSGVGGMQGVALLEIYAVH